MSYGNNNKGNAGNGGFDLANYETVKQRKVRLRKDYPNSIIHPMTISGIGYANNFVMHVAMVWKEKTEMSLTPEVVAAISDLAKSATHDNAGIVATTIAIMTRADSVGHSLSLAGGPKADKNAWVENSEESAVGRALDNLGYHSGSCSQEEMIKVGYTEATQQQRVRLENEINGILMDLAARQVNLVQLHQECIRRTRPFQQLHELSVDELTTIQNFLTSNQPITA
ncbi:hypothetical protein GZH47_33335 (plasmid) [Paenibacillus rhizovicinus]|uniref:Uncharacterized protein n=1 Tax=Paenibacillus rhizovicinus TaxID=2704463 RepID=A0A6C0PBG2_9BACL|nr:hypothetical protein [Paenibacillus rhizovicinus]QHW35779.1 hypothetical protein GZH47_33335 [Paenibacillus rhizovicinus]